ncbi:MAG: helix-turn-helix domain-containing protein [Firmicutes bacterium]|nr:helix-turn-helix domain-containing protein [Bacillota bacterium]
MNLYDKIKEICKAKNITINQVSTALGLGNSVMSKWQHSTPKADTLVRVADYLDVTVNELLNIPEVRLGQYKFNYARRINEYLYLTLSNLASAIDIANEKKDSQLQDRLESATIYTVQLFADFQNKLSMVNDTDLIIKQGRKGFEEFMNKYGVIQAEFYRDEIVKLKPNKTENND